MTSRLYFCHRDQHDECPGVVQLTGPEQTTDLVQCDCLCHDVDRLQIPLPFDDDEPAWAPEPA